MTNHPADPSVSVPQPNPSTDWPRCPECGHMLSAAEHSDWCATARDPQRLRERLDDCESVHAAERATDPACAALRREYDRMAGDLAVAVAEAGRAREALQAVRELHHSVRFEGQTACAECDHFWPCPTVRALDAALDGAE